MKFQRYVLILNYSYYFVMSIMVLLTLWLLRVLDLSNLFYDFLIGVPIMYVTQFFVFKKMRDYLLKESALSRFSLFLSTLDKTHIQGIDQYYLEKVTSPFNDNKAKNYACEGYEYFFILHRQEYPYFDLIDESMKDIEPDKAIRLSLIRLIELIENNKLEKAIVAIDKILETASVSTTEHLDEIMVKQVEKDLHLLRKAKVFVNNPTMDTAMDCFPDTDRLTYIRVLILFGISYVFLHKGQNKEAKKMLSYVLDIEGDFRLLKDMKNTYNVL